MLIRTQARLYNTDEARYLEVRENEYGKFEANLEIIWGWLDSEGCSDSSRIFSGTAGECQAMLDRISSAIVQGEIGIFKIKDNGTKREKVELETLPETETEMEIPF